ncbi:MAG: GerMN domain-containing protein [Clostridia bacterium]|jgi:spore germination protein GerM|nr:GerMN domain-containing protein [Clostridia bacterium]MDH7573053.1 GerMN domain-containing protein [Clostridia bacterium]
MRGKRLLVTLLVLALGLSLVWAGGCGLLKSGSEETPGESTGAEAGQEGTLPEETPETAEQVPPGPGETTTVTLYFADPTGQYLVPVTRQIPKVQGIARATLQELILGPDAQSDLLPTVPVGTVLRDINIKPDGLAIVDFSKELVANHQGGTMGEMLTVYSIVNTLTQFPTVKKVQILVDGQYQQTLAGHLDIREALARNEGLILPK